MINPNEPAFPFFEYNEAGYGNALVIYDRDGGKQILPFKPGLSIRAEIASRCMQGLLASWGQHDVTDYSELAHDAVLAADALIAELNKPTP